MLTDSEFDLIDRFMHHRSPASYDTISAMMGWTGETTRRICRAMQSAGVLAVARQQEERMDTDVKNYYGAGKSNGRMVIKSLIGVTMKGLMLWHMALGEEWDWEEYDGQPWIAIEGVLPGRSGETIASALAERRMAIPQFSIEEARRT